MRNPALVFSGGNALGAYHAGAWSAFEAEGLVPSWILGSSIGAITAAIIAGNPPGTRMHALDSFWAKATSPDARSIIVAPLLQRAMQYGQALTIRVFGRGALFRLNPFSFSDHMRPGIFDTGPMRQILTEVIDFDRLNCGDLRLSIVAVDLATGEETVFDTAKSRVNLDHVMASAALIPDFPPVEIDGRFYVDGGFIANLPAHIALDEARAEHEHLCCFVADLFPSQAPLPQGLLQAAQRQTDLLFACQSKKMFAAAIDKWEGIEPGADVFPVSYAEFAQETALKGFDFSATTLERRRGYGARDMQWQISQWREASPSLKGLVLHPAPSDASRSPA